MEYSPSQFIRAPADHGDGGEGPAPADPERSTFTIARNIILMLALGLTITFLLDRVF